MAETTGIAWTNSTWNPVRGCSRVSLGCGGPNHEGGCYAEKVAARFSDVGQPYHGLAERTSHGGRWTGQVRLIDATLTLPLRWKKPRRIFVNSMSDLFHENLPDEAIDKIFAVMALAPQHTFQILTKRAQRMRKYISDCSVHSFGPPDACTRIAEAAIVLAPADIRRKWPLPNVWLGVSVEDQARADERIPDLLATPAAVRFISAEPLLGPVDLTWLGHDGDGVIDALRGEDWIHYSGDVRRVVNRRERLSWVIVGGESGPKARPMHPDWARSLRDQCQAAGVSFFFKQWGEWAPVIDIDGSVRSEGAGSAGALHDGREWRFIERGNGHSDVSRVGKKAAGRLLDGREHNEMPHD